jgi:DNA-binding CsgD family transcriptional regulator
MHGRHMPTRRRQVALLSGVKQHHEKPLVKPAAFLFSAGDISAAFNNAMGVGERTTTGEDAGGAGLLERKFISDTSTMVGEAFDRAPFDPSGWNDAVNVLLRSYPGAAIALKNLDPAARTLRFDCIEGFDPDFVASFRDHYVQVNPWVDYFSKVTPGSVIVSERDCPAREFRDSEFYNDWLVPQKCVEAGSAIMLEASATDIIVLTIHYPLHEAEIFDRSVSEMLQRIRGQLQRSVEMARTFERVLDKERSVSALLARSGDIAFVIDEERRLHAASDIAEAHFRAATLVSGSFGYAGLLVPEIDSWLRRVLHCLASDIPLDSTSRIFRQEKEIHQISIGLLPRGNSIVSPISGRRLFLVTIRSLSTPGEGRSILEFGKAFGLTPAEVRLCSLLGENYTLKESGDLLGVTHETVRQRLKTVFQKTGTNRQSELMALLKRLM